MLVLFRPLDLIPSFILDFKMRKYLYIVILSLLFLPLIQQNVNWFSFEKLNGAFVLAEKPVFSIDSWWKGEYTKKYDAYLTDNHGFKEFFVRSYNQFYYSVFNTTKSTTCAVGQENQLFLNYYVDSYLGKDFVGKEKIERTVDKIKFVQDYLAFKGISLITVFAPGKGGFYSGLLPVKYLNTPKTISNMDYYVALMEANKMKHVNLSSYFNKMKKTSKYPLYPQNGGHWSDYGMYLGMDSIMKYIEKDRSIDLPNLILKRVDLTDSLIEPDNDIEKTMNLFYRITQAKMPFTRFDVEENPAKIKPKLLAVSDSYYWQALNRNIHQRVFNQGEFWYYNQTAMPENIAVSTFDFKQKILEKEVILLIATEGTLNLYPYGFIDKAYELFMINDVDVMSKQFEESMHNDLSWLSQLEQKAKENKNTLEKQIQLDARYLAELRYNTLQGEEKQIAEKMAVIKSQKPWYDSILEKAKTLNIHPELMLYLDAKYVLDMERK